MERRFTREESIIPETDWDYYSGLPSPSYYMKKSVWVNGTFDFLHLGHLRLLEYAAQWGTVRVGIDTDRRVQQRKGKNRPFYTILERREMLLHCKWVDSVVGFDTDDELREQIRLYNPEILVVGEEYRGQVIGAELVPQIMYYPRNDKYSTTQTLKNI